MAELGDTELGRWLSEVRAGNEVRLRQRQRWMEIQATENATFVGTLTDIAESGHEVVIDTVSGRHHTGRIQAVGLDFCAVTTQGRWIFIPLRAMTSVRSISAMSRTASGDRVQGLDLTLLEALADQLPERPRVVLWLSSGEGIRGELLGVGRDLVSVGLEGPEAHRVHIAAEAISELLI